MDPATAAESSGDVVVIVHADVEHPGGAPSPVDFEKTFTDDQIHDGLPLDAVGGTYSNTNGLTFLESNHRAGVSLRELVTAGAGVPLASVASADISLTDVSTPGRLSQASSDLADPADPSFPFENAAQPAFIYDGNALLFAVGARTVAPVDPPVMNGTYFQAANGAQLTLLLHLTTTLARASVTPATSSIDQGESVRFTGSVSDLVPSESVAWSWKVGDVPIAGTSATVSHQFPDAGDFNVTGTATTENGSTGTVTASVHVAGRRTSTSPPPPTSPPPTGPQRGTGGPTAPNVGPVDGTGPRVNGVPTDGPGRGAAGPSRAPGSATASAPATASDGAADVDGTVVGYVLSDPTSVAVPRQAAARPVDDSAAAERYAVTPLRWGWLVGGAVVVVLLALGAGSERRRPLRARRR